MDARCWKGNSVRKIIITVRVVKNWKKLLREAAAYSPLEIFSTLMDMALRWIREPPSRLLFQPK